jgi:protein required for attachment to host cells
MPLPHNAEVLVIDGRKLLFFRNHGDGARIDLRTQMHETRDDAADRELKTDQAGQSPAPGGTGLGGGTMGETDYHQQDEDRFAVHAADMLKRRTLGGDTHPLAIIAAPKTLGVLRAKQHKEVEKRVVLELAKDMTNRPVADIEALLEGEAAPPA